MDKIESGSEGKDLKNGIIITRGHWKKIPCSEGVIIILVVKFHSYFQSNSAKYLP